MEGPTSQYLLRGPSPAVWAMRSTAVNPRTDSEESTPPPAPPPPPPPPEALVAAAREWAIAVRPREPESRRRAGGRPPKHALPSSSPAAADPSLPPPPPSQSETTVGVAVAASEWSAGVRGHAPRRPLKHAPRRPGHSPVPRGSVNYAAVNPNGKRPVPSVPSSVGSSPSTISGHDGRPLKVHVLECAVGEDVGLKILSFLPEESIAICVVSASGTVSKATLGRPSDGIVTHEGTSEIVHLSGLYMPSVSTGRKHRSGGLSVTLRQVDGQLIGGAVAGSLVAAKPVQVVIGSFCCEVATKTSVSDHPAAESTSIVKHEGVGSG